MMDISFLAEDNIRSLSREYEYLQEDPFLASKSLRKAMRRKTEDNIGLFYDFTQEAADRIFHLDNDAFFTLLKDCYEHEQVHRDQRNERFLQAVDGLNKNAVNILRSVLLSQSLYGSIAVSVRNNSVYIKTGLYQFLVLTGAEGLPDGECTISLCRNSELSKRDGRFVLPFEASDGTIIYISFSDIEVRTEITRADEISYYSSPWEHLANIARRICNKDLSDQDLYNVSEKEILPLCTEMMKLHRYTIDGGIDFSYGNFPILRSFFEKYALTKAVNLLDTLSSLEVGHQNIRKRILLSQKLFSVLNLKENEPLWRELYETLCASQSGYKTTAEICCDEQKLQKIRDQIERLMKSYGYTGTYPEFEKKAPLKGVHLTESYGLSYFVTAEKNAVSRIRCLEDYDNGKLTVSFLYGTGLWKKDGEVKDFFSLTFNAKGKSRFGFVDFTTETVSENGVSGDLKEIVGIAVKKAEMKKLTKEEYALSRGALYSPVRHFLSVFLWMGGFFSILFTLGMMLFGIVMCLVEGKPGEILAVLTDFRIWGFTLIAGWVGFGGAMGIITVAAEKRK